MKQIACEATHYSDVAAARRRRRAWCAYAAFALTALAANGAGAATLSLPAGAEIEGVGATAAMSVSIDSAAALESADLQITYDAAIVSATGAIGITGISAGCTAIGNSPTPGVLRIALACEAPLSGGGQLLTATFRGEAAGLSNLAIAGCSLNEGFLDCSVNSGSVNVLPPTPTPTRTRTATSTPTFTPIPPTRTFTPSATRTRTATRTATVVVAPSALSLNPISQGLTLGGTATLTGTGFTAGSRIVGFISTAQGALSIGALAPRTWSPTQLLWDVPSALPLGQGFAVIAVVNTDQNYIGSEYQQALLYGNAALNRPTITGINGVGLHAPDGALPAVYINTPVFPGTVITLTGTGFNNALVNFYTGVGNIGPLTPLSGATSTEMRLIIPSSTPLGLGAFEVINSPYAGWVGSQTVFVPVGNPPAITGVSQSGTTITVNGSGFVNGLALNLFAQVAGGSANFGPGTTVTFVSSQQLRFTRPANAAPGPAFVEVINPPYIPFTSTASDPDGSFVLQ